MGPLGSLWGHYSLRGHIWPQIWNQWPQVPTYPYAYAYFGPILTAFWWPQATTSSKRPQSSNVTSDLEFDWVLKRSKTALTFTDIQWGSQFCNAAVHILFGPSNGLSLVTGEIAFSPWHIFGRISALNNIFWKATHAPSFTPLFETEMNLKWSH